MNPQSPATGPGPGLLPGGGRQKKTEGGVRGGESMHIVETRVFCTLYFKAFYLLLKCWKLQYKQAISLALIGL